MFQDLIFPLTTTSFAYPWAFMVLVLLIYLRLVRTPLSVETSVPCADAYFLSSIPKSLRLRLRGPILGSVLWAAIILLTIAAARPQRVTPIVREHSGRNLILAIDISKSMATADFSSGFGALSRLGAVQLVVSEFISERVDDRIGVVVFGSRAYLQSPLTRDHEIVLQLVRRLSVGLAGDGTAIGDGLGLSLKRIREVGSDSSAIILMTDGVSNSGEVNPLQAAKIAADLGIKVHAVGIGSSNPSFTNRFLLPGQGRPEFDEKTLRTISELTGGVYFNAEDLEGLKRVYEEIDELEKTESDDTPTEKIEELYFRYLLIGACFIFMYLLLEASFFLRIP